MGGMLWGGIVGKPDDRVGVIKTGRDFWDHDSIRRAIHRQEEASETWRVDGREEGIIFKHQEGGILMLEADRRC